MARITIIYDPTGRLEPPRQTTTQALRIKVATLDMPNAFDRANIQDTSRLLAELLLGQMPQTEELTELPSESIHDGTE